MRRLDSTDLRQISTQPKQRMNDALSIALKISLVIFMVGNLLDMGLRLKLNEALAGLRNVRFVLYSLVWGFVLLPALAVLLTKSFRWIRRMPSGSSCWR